MLCSDAIELFHEIETATTCPMFMVIRRTRFHTRIKVLMSIWIYIKKGQVSSQSMSRTRFIAKLDFHYNQFLHSLMSPIPPRASTIECKWYTQHSQGPQQVPVLNAQQNLGIGVSAECIMLCDRLSSVATMLETVPHYERSLHGHEIVCTPMSSALLRGNLVHCRKIYPKISCPSVHHTLQAYMSREKSIYAAGVESKADMKCCGWHAPQRTLAQDVRHGRPWMRHGQSRDTWKTAPDW